MKIEEIEIKKIRDNPYQTRGFIEKGPLKSLTKSILQRGLINPINVLKDKNDYIIISGHRRFNAYQNLKRKKIPCIVKSRQINNELIVDLIHENLIREDLTPIEKANSIRLLLSQIKGTKNDIDRMLYIVGCLKNYLNRGRKGEFKLRHIEGFEENDIFIVDNILKSINVTCNTATTYLQILKLPRHIQKELSFKKKGYNRDGKIIVSQAEQLARVEDKDYQNYLFEKCLNGSNGKRIQALVNEYKRKLESGEWKGFTRRKQTGFTKIKSQVGKVEELSDLCKKLSAKLRSFNIDTLIQLDETLEKEEFIVSMRELKKEIIIVRDRINEKLTQKGFHEFKRDITIFELNVRPQSKKRNKEMRFTFPVNVAREINLPYGKSTKLKLKVVGIEDKNV